MSVHSTLPGQLEDVWQTSDIVIVAVADNDLVGGFHTYVEPARVAHNDTALARIEQDSLRARVDPQRQAVFAQQPPRTGGVVN